MNSVISELSRQLQFHIETTRLLDKGDKDDRELIQKLRRSLLEAESQLNTERALHAVTRSSVQALEEDCSRLRQTISLMRRRGTETERYERKCLNLLKIKALHFNLPVTIDNLNLFFFNCFWWLFLDFILLGRSRSIFFLYISLNILKDCSYTFSVIEIVKS